MSISGTPRISQMQTNGPHALIVGGTGMLAAASEVLAQRGYRISVFARRPERLRERRGVRESDGVSLIAIDYSDEARLRAEVERVIQAGGPISFAVIWTHSTAPNAPFIVAETINRQDRTCAYFHILGSESANPAVKSEDLRASFETLNNIQYHRVILGFVIEGKSSRWLTNEEISSGIIAAIDSGQSDFIVGMVRPWAARP